MAKKSPAAQTNDPATINTTEKKRSRAKSEYVIERKITRADQHGTDINGWERSAADPFKDTAEAIKYMSDSDSPPTPGEYRIVVVKWQKTIKVEQQAVVRFE